MSNSYIEKLRDPRWQRKRLEIMQRDNFTCRCGVKDRTLHVHHCFYEWGKEPWDYPDSSLVTLCEGCHSNEDKEIVRNAQKHLLRVLAQRGFTGMDMSMLAMQIELG